MNATNLYGTTQANAARALIGAGVLADNRNDLYRQILVALANRTGGGSGGSGTVTAFAFTNGNGIVGAVTTPNTTPTLALTLGAITPTTVNGLTFAQSLSGFTIQGGTFSSKTLSIGNSLVFQGTDGSTLDIGTGGTLGTAAYTASNAYVPAASVTGGGVIATGGFTLTVPATGTAALLGAANVFTAGQTVSGASLTLSGNQSAAAWTTTGIRLIGVPGTLTDTSSSGTVAAAYTDKLGGNTIAASNATTFTNYISAYFSSPTAGTNVTFTQKWGCGTDYFMAQGNGAAGQPTALFSGTPYTAGTATSNKPAVLIEPTGTTSNAWSTSGTLLGVNAASGSTADLIVACTNSASSGNGRFTVNYQGRVTTDTLLIGNTTTSINANAYFQGNCVITGGVYANRTATAQYWFGAADDLILSRIGAASLGLGVGSATPITQSISGAPGSGTNITGGTLNIGTKGTGTGLGGVINLQTHAAGSSGSALGTLVNVLSIVAPGQVKITGIPTSSAGLASGTIYSNAGILAIVP